MASTKIAGNTPPLQIVGRHAAPKPKGRRYAAWLGMLGLGSVSIASGATMGWIVPVIPTVQISTSAAASVPTSPSGTDEIVAEPVGFPDQSVVQEIFEPRTVTILGVGDILVHREILQQARTDGAGGVDFLPQLEAIRPIVESVDLAVCHMEYPLGSRDGPWSVWPDPVNAPPHLADAIVDLGFDVCSTASNHSLARGFTGVASTIQALQEVGLPHAGTAISEEDSTRTTIVTVNDVPVALLSYTYGFNGIPRPFDWCCNLIDPDRIVADAQRARSQGAAIVVVSLHQGVEGIAAPTYEQRTTIDALAASGFVDLVIGHHAHVVQPVTRVGEMWVAYGHGNLLTAQSRRDPRTGDGLLTVFTFEERPDGTFAGISATGHALVNEDFPFRVYPVGDPNANSARAEATWQRVSQQVTLADDTSGFRLERWSSAGTA